MEYYPFDCRIEEKDSVIEQGIECLSGSGHDDGITITIRQEAVVPPTAAGDWTITEEQVSYCISSSAECEELKQETEALKQTAANEEECIQQLTNVVDAIYSEIKEKHEGPTFPCDEDKLADISHSVSLHPALWSLNIYVPVVDMRCCYKSS
jgi:hypothetical protein